MKNVKWKITWIMSMVVLLVASCPLLAFAADEEEYVPELYDLVVAAAGGSHRSGADYERSVQFPVHRYCNRRAVLFRLFF